MIKTLIVGVSGFSGKHLYRNLRKSRDKNLFGTYHKNLGQDSVKFFESDIKVIRCNIIEYEEIKSVLKRILPDEIYFLSSLVTVAKSEQLALNIYNTNISGTYNFYEAVKNICPDARVVAVGSAEEYGKVKPEHLPIKESIKLNPVSSYGLSKKLAEEIGLFYHSIYNINIRFTRTFHFSGPMQPPTFVISDFAKQIFDIERGKKDKILVGNLNARRDFTDIRDVVGAYYEIMKNGKSGEVYNVCSGNSHAIAEILDILIQNSKMKINVEIDKNKLRSLDVPDIKGDNQKLIDHTGWKPIYNLEITMADVLNFWRTLV